VQEKINSADIKTIVLFIFDKYQPAAVAILLRSLQLRFAGKPSHTSVMIYELQSFYHHVDVWLR
jgi:hypothetical protein